MRAVLLTGARRAFSSRADLRRLRDLLPRIVGLGRATEMIPTGDPVDAAEAFRIGLVSRVVPADPLLDAALAVAGRRAAGPVQAIARAKAAIDQGPGSDLAGALDRDPPPHRDAVSA